MVAVADYYVHPTAIVEEGASIGRGTKVWHFVHIRRGARVGQGCNLGKGVYVDSGAVVGDGVKVQNFVSVYRGVRVESRAFLGPSATLTNDRYPRSFSEEWELVPTIIEEGASIGANATIVCGVRIGKYAMVGAGAVVTRDVPPHGLVYGNPARLRGFVCTCGRRLKRLVEVGSEYVTFKCEHCGREVRVSRRDYVRMILESATA
ncbi:MAG: N-acetyltransferase [Thermoproteales archaeon]|nr:N-acetyltransferase [Thermoproteales archaeon]